MSTQYSLSVIPHVGGAESSSVGIAGLAVGKSVGTQRFVTVELVGVGAGGVGHTPLAHLTPDGHYIAQPEISSRLVLISIRGTFARTSLLHIPQLCGSDFEMHLPPQNCLLAPQRSTHLLPSHRCCEVHYKPQIRSAVRLGIGGREGNLHSYTHTAAVHPYTDTSPSNKPVQHRRHVHKIHNFPPHHFQHPGTAPYKESSSSYSHSDPGLSFSPSALASPPASLVHTRNMALVVSWLE
jgi:hypothetical protein